MSVAVRFAWAEYQDDAGDDFGIVVAVRDAFGFVQPLLKDEQLYFSLRDMRSEILVGDLVRYRERANVKGLTAEQIRIVTGGLQTCLGGAVIGTVAREPDLGRRVPGLVNVTSHTIVDVNGDKYPLPLQVPFVPGPLEGFISGHCCPAISSTSLSSASPSKGSSRRVIKGDEVQFDCFHIPNSRYFHGYDAKVTRLKKEVQFALQIQRMLDAGAVQEMGIIDTIKGDYGFLKPRDRKEQIYFRLSDMLDQEQQVETVRSYL
jgi:cold shock CspA family protein